MNATMPLLPPPHCFSRDEGTHTLISARVSTGVMGWFVMLFTTMWNSVVLVQLAFFFMRLQRGGTFETTVNGKVRTISAGESALFLAPFVLVGLGTLLAAIYMRRGRVEARVTHDSVHLFTGVMRLGRSTRVPRAVIRDVTIRDAGMRSSSGDHPEVISLEGCDVTTGLALGRAGRAWFVQELRGALKLPSNGV